MDYIIKLKQGLDNISFDMSVDEVVAILGTAEETETINNAVDETTTVLHYCDRTVTLFFEGEKPTLNCIDISNEKATLFGEELFDMGEREIVKLMVDHNYCEQDVEKEDWGERRITFGEGNIDFYFEDDDLLAIVYGK